MKTLNTIIKILTALAAVAGAIYVVATYGDRIVAWAKKIWASVPKCPDVTVDVNIDPTPEADEEDFEEAAAEPTAEAVAEEAEEVPTEEEEVAVEEIPLTPVAPNEPVADEHDFAE